MTDRLTAGLDALDRVPVEVRWADVERRIEQGGWSGPPGSDASGRRSGRAWWLVAAAALVVLAIGVLVVGSHGSPDTPPRGGGTTATTTIYNTTDPSGEDYITPDQAAHLAGWLAEYDPAEIAYLQAQVNNTADDLMLVTTLEFRQACRELDRAATAAKAVPIPDRAAVVDPILDPEIQRLRERENPASTTGAYFAQLAAKLDAGDDAAVTSFLASDCASTLAFGH